MGPSLQLSTCVLFWGFLGLFVPAVEGTKPRSSSVSSQANAILSCNNVTLLALLDVFRRKVKRLVEDFLQTAQLEEVGKICDIQPIWHCQSEIVAPSGEYK